MSGPPPEEQEHDPYGGYDPELPFLYALEREITRRARRAHEVRERRRPHAGALRGRATARATGTYMGTHMGTEALLRDGAVAEGSRRSHGSRRRPGMAPAGTRVARRSLTLVALLCLIGASAYGAGRIFSAQPSSPAAVAQSAFAQVASGSSGPDRWSLRAYLRGGQLCRVLMVADTESSRCSSPPHARSLGVTSVLSPTRIYVYGVSGPAVSRVRARTGAASAGTRTHPLGGAAVGLPRGARWFVVVLGRPVAEPDPRVTVRGLDASGAPVGLPVSDCAEATETELCQP